MKAVVSIIGHDRTGFVSEVTQIADELKLNIEDSRMTVLGGEFALLMSLAGLEEHLQDFRDKLEKMAGEEISYIFRPTAERQAAIAARPYTANIVAIDHPGIVASVAGFFAARNINIYDLETTATPAAHTGTPIFNVRLTAEIPAELSIRSVRQAFDDFCEAQDLDGALDPKA